MTKRYLTGVNRKTQLHSNYLKRKALAEIARKQLIAKRCVKCDLLKYASDFYAWGGHTDGYRNWCKDCTYDHRKYHLKTKYALSIEDYQAMSDSQGGMCAICNRIPARLYVDHDHMTNRIRGLLCQQCNAALGLFGESVQTLKIAITYLES